MVRRHPTSSAKSTAHYLLSGKQQTHIVSDQLLKEVEREAAKETLKRDVFSGVGGDHRGKMRVDFGLTHIR